MQTQTIKTELSFNGQNVVIGHKFLEDIVDDIPDIKENRSIFDILALSDNPEVKERVSRKDSLSKKTIHLLLKDTDQKVVNNILSNSDLAKHIEEKALLKIIKSNNIKHLVSIGETIDDYSRCDQCKIIKILANHKNPLVRSSLLNWRTSELITIKTLKKLSEDKDIDIANDAKDELKRRV